jgi:hypothetical protein
MQYHHAHERSYAADMTSPKTIQKLLEISHKKAMTIQVFQLSMFHYRDGDGLSGLRWAW